MRALLLWCAAAVVFSVHCGVSSAHLCLAVPQQRAPFPAADYAAHVKSAQCQRNLGLTPAAWISSTVGGVCGVAAGGVGYSAGAISATYTEHQTIVVQYQQNANHYNCPPTSMNVSFSAKTNPSAESDFVQLASFAALDGTPNYNTTVTLPAGVTCDSCVLRVVYHTGSTGVGVCNTTAPAYYQCADVRIVGTGPNGGQIAAIVLIVIVLVAAGVVVFLCRSRICPSVFPPSGGSTPFSSTTSMKAGLATTMLRQSIRSAV